MVSPMSFALSISLESNAAILYPAFVGACDDVDASTEETQMQDEPCESFR